MSAERCLDNEGFRDANQVGKTSDHVKSQAASSSGIRSEVPGLVLVVDLSGLETMPELAEESVVEVTRGAAAWRFAMFPNGAGGAGRPSSQFGRG